MKKHIACTMSLALCLCLLAGCGPDMPAQNTEPNITAPATGSPQITTATPPVTHPLELGEAREISEAWAVARLSGDSAVLEALAAEGLEPGKAGGAGYTICSYVFLPREDFCEIIYSFDDAFGNRFYQHEIIQYHHIGDTPCISASSMQPVTWERNYAFFTTAKEAYEAMAEAIISGNYYGALAIAADDEYNEASRIRFDSMSRSAVTLTASDVRNSQALFTMTIESGGQGRSYSLVLRQDDRGWQGTMLPAEGEPHGWETTLPLPPAKPTPYDASDPVTDSQLVLPNGVALGMDYDRVARLLGGFEMLEPRFPGYITAMDRSVSYRFALEDGAYILDYMSIFNNRTDYSSIAGGGTVHPYTDSLLRSIRFGDSLCEVLKKLPAAEVSLAKPGATQLLYGDAEVIQGSAYLQYAFHAYSILIYGTEHCAVLDFADDDLLFSVHLFFIGEDTVPPELSPLPTVLPIGLKAVLLEGDTFIDSFSKEAMDISGLIESLYNDSVSSVEILQVAAADLDADGVAEAVLWLSVNGTGDYGFEILRQQDDAVYGYFVPYRGLYELKADGTFSYSGGATNHGFGIMTFTEDCCTVKKITYCEDSATSSGNPSISYYVEGEASTPGSFEYALAHQAVKPDAIWHEFTTGGINNLFSD